VFAALEVDRISVEHQNMGDVDHGIIGNTYELFVDVINTTNETMTFLMSEVSLTSSDGEDVVSLTDAYYNDDDSLVCGDPTVCALVGNFYVTLVFEINLSTTSGERTFTLEINSSAVDFGEVNDSISVTSVLDEIMDCFGTTTAIIRGNYINVTIDDINFADTPFEYLQADYGEFFGLFNFNTLYNGFTFEGYVINTSNDLYTSTFVATNTNLKTFFREYCKQKNIFSDTICDSEIPENESFTNITVANAIIEYANDANSLKQSNFDFNGNITKSGSQIFAEAYYGQTTQDIIDEMESILNYTTSTVPLILLDSIEDAYFKDLNMNVQNTSTANTVFQKNGLSTTAGSYNTYLQYTDQYGNVGLREVIVQVINTVPTTPTMNILPTIAYAVSNLTCVASNSSDVDGDTVTYIYDWYKDDVLQTAQTSSTVPYIYTKYGENWTCAVTPFDGVANGPSVTDSVVILMGTNTAPQITGVIQNVTTPENTPIDAQNLSSLRYDLEDHVNNLIWSLIGVNNNLYFATIVNNLLSISPVSGQHGSDSLIVRLTDQGGLSDSQEILVNITSVNENPIITTVPTTTATEDQQYLYDVNAVDGDDDTLTYSLQTAPSGMNINSTSGLITWTPTNTQANTQGGIYSVVVMVSDVEANDNQSFSITVTPVNDAPTISGLPNPSGFEDQQFTLDVSPYIDDVDDTKALLTITTNSSYATMFGQTIVFQYPDGITSENVLVTVKDDDGLSASDTIVVSITAINDAPSTPVISVTPKSPAATNSLTCTVVTPSTDIDSETITYNFYWYLNGLLQENTSTTQTSNILSSSLLGGQVWSCNVTATDGTNSTTEVSDSVTVGNTAPTTPVVDVTPNVAYTTNNLVCSIITSSTDADNDTITYSYRWYKKTSGQTQFYLQPQTTATLANSNTIRGDTWKCEVRAYDTKAYSTAVYDTVTIMNSKPTISSPTPSTSTVTTNEQTSKVFSITPADVDSTDTLTVKWYKGTSVVGTGNSYTYTPTYTSAGTYTIKVVVSDGLLTVERSWILGVTDVNRNPVIGTIGSKTCNERSTCTIYVSATDQDTDDSIKFYDDTTLFTINVNTGAISFTAPNVLVDSTSNVRITVVDTKGGYGTEIFPLTIKNVNRAPILNPVGSLSAAENQTFSKQLTASDPDSDSLIYSDNATLFNITSSGLISFAPTQADVGVHTVRISIDDSHGGYDYEDITVHVLNTNNAPVINDYYPAVSTVSLNELQSQTFNVSATDQDGTTSNIKWYKNSVLVGQTDTYTMTTSYTSAGRYTILAMVDDGILSDTQSWTVNVANVNRAPQITAIPSQTAYEGQPFTYSVQATDADGNTLVYSTDSSLFRIGLLTGKIQFTPVQPTNEVDTHTITVYVADGTTRKSTTFELKITNVNDAPVLPVIGSITAVENELYTKTISATDKDGDVLIYDDNTGLFDTNPSTGVISFTPGFQDSGSYPVRITVRDTHGSMDYEDITVTVLETNQAPNITAYTPAVASVSMKEDNSTTFNVSATDSDGTTPSYKWYLDSTIVGTDSTYTFEGNFTTSGTNAGNYNVTVVVSDGSLTDTNVWALQVNRTRDSDTDYIPDYIDNCKLIYNPDQTDLDNSTPEGLLCENNIDGDDIPDDEDFILGSAENMELNFENAEFKIENSTDLNQEINGTKEVSLTYKEYDTETGLATEYELVSFNFDFNESQTLDLGNVTVKTQDEDATAGSVIIAGINLESQSETKTVYVQDLDNTKNSVCIKDAEIASITEIRGTCNGANEFKLPCTQSGHSRTVNGNTYTCTDLGDRYKIEGLLHSGVRELACTPSWSCDSWSSCVGGVQTCSGWTDANSCGETYSDSNTQSCASGSSYQSVVSEEEVVVPIKVGVWLELRPGVKRTWVVGGDIYIDSIIFEVSELVTNVKFSVEQPETPTIAKEGKIFKYFNIEKTNIENSQFAFVYINFRVPKTWLTEQMLDSEKISLFRYTENSWEELPTTFSSEDADNVYYESESAGLSLFAIGEKKVIVEVPEAEDLESTDKEKPVVEVEDDVKDAKEMTDLEEKLKDLITIKPIPKIFLKGVLGVVLLILILLLIVSFLKFLDRPPKPPTSESKKKLKDAAKESTKKDQTPININQVEDYIIDNLSKGHSKQRIKEALLTTGWNLKQIDPLLRQYSVSFSTDKNVDSLIDKHLKKAEKHYQNSLKHEKKIRDYKKAQKLAKVKKSEKKVLYHKKQMEFHRKTAQHHYKQVNLKKALDLHKKGERFYNAGNMTKAQHHYKLAQKYREEAEKKL